jgi:hypothetical protein
LVWFLEMSKIVVNFFHDHNTRRHEVLNMQRWCSRTTTIPLFECGHEIQVLLPLGQMIKHRNTMQC